MNSYAAQSSYDCSDEEMKDGEADIASNSEINLSNADIRVGPQTDMITGQGSTNGSSHAGGNPS